MKFVRGRTFKRAISDFHAQTGLAKSAVELEWSKLLQYFMNLCHAVAYAHSRGVLHRDIKPDNVMLGPYGETLVLDWGIAKVIGQTDLAPGGSGDSFSGSGTGSVRTNVATSSAETMEGTLLGTPSYMAPEMAEGRASELDERTDVYLLGATLYEVITGQMPRQGTSRDELIELARSVTPPPARKLRPSCPRALEAIAFKAMAQRKDQRYPTAMALAGDMQLYLAGEPVSACRESALDRTLRWCKRNRRFLQRLTLAISMGVLLVFSAATAMHLKKLQSREHAREDLARFNLLADEAHYFAANTDSLSEQVPYFDPGKGQTLADEAIALAAHWGSHLETWPLADDLPRLRSDLYALLLLDAQVRIDRKEDAKATTELLDRAIAINPTPSQGYRRLRAANDPSEAGSFAAAATPLDADDLFLQGEQARTLTANSDRSKAQIQHALADYQAAVRLQPSHYWSNFQIGRCYLSLGQQDEAVSALTTCIALRPDVLWAYSARGLALALQRRYTEAESDLNRAIDLEREFTPAILNRGVCYWMQGKTDQALEDFEHALHPHAGNGLSEALFYRGQIYLARGDYAPAAEAFSELVAARGGFLRVRLLLGEAHVLQGDLAAGTEDLNGYLTATGFNTGDVTAAAAARGHLLRGFVPDLPPGSARQIAKQASDELQTAIRLGGQSAAVYCDLGAVAETITGFADSIPFYTQSIQLTDDPQVRLRRGCAYLRLLRIDEAKNDFVRAVELDPADPKAHFWLGYANALAGRNDVAMQEAAQTLAEGGDDYVDLHNVACIFARFARADSAHQDEYLRLTVTLLGRAEGIWRTRTGGVSEIDAIRKEKDFQFDPLQTRRDFQALVTAHAEAP